MGVPPIDTANMLASDFRRGTKVSFRGPSCLAKSRRSNVLNIPYQQRCHPSLIRSKLMTLDDCPVRTTGLGVSSFIDRLMYLAVHQILNFLSFNDILNKCSVFCSATLACPVTVYGNIIMIQQLA